MNITLLGIFSNRTNAEEAIMDLTRGGFDARDISLVMKNENGKIKTHHGTNIAESAASGVVTGGVLGGLAGLLVGLGALTLPGIGALFVAGPIAASLGLVGAAATTVSGALTGAVAGGMVGALVGLGLPEEEARKYEDRVRDGGILIAVPSLEAEVDQVRDILTKHGADMIRSVSGKADPEPEYAAKPYADDRYYNPDPVYYSDIRHGNREGDHRTSRSLKAKLQKLFS